MKIKNNEILKNYTTMKIGGVAQNFYIPQSVEELLVCLRSLGKNTYYLLGNGSNILINDTKTFEHVVWLKEFNKACEFHTDGRFYFGASLPIQQVINFANKQGFGGLEYLYSVPSLLGGAVAMNAGRGKRFNRQISDYIVSVDILDLETLEKKTIACSACQFSYRNSIFKHHTDKYIVLGGTFVFPAMSMQESSRRKQERMAYAAKLQDHNSPNLGSIFRRHNHYLTALFRWGFWGRCGGCRFSHRTVNWLINTGNGTYRQMLTLIKRVEKIHALLGCKIEREIVTWD